MVPAHQSTEPLKSLEKTLSAQTPLNLGGTASPLNFRGRPSKRPIKQPKGPFRTKNTTTIAKIVNYYAVVFLLRPPNLLRRGPFFERKNVCNSQENGVRARCAAMVNHTAVRKILRVVNVLHVLFLVRWGPLGRGFGPSAPQIWGVNLRPLNLGGLG